MIICLVVIMTLGNMQHQALFLLFLPVLALSQSVCIGPNQNTCYQGLSLFTFPKFVFLFLFTITEFVEKIHKNLVGICFFTELVICSLY